MPVNTSFAIAVGKTSGMLARRLGLGGGTNLPGTLARRVDPQVLRSLVAALPHGVVLISGTNGKTTTSRMLAAILEQADQRVLHNRAGANLITGLTATAISGANWRGQAQASIGLFETDEAALPQALAETQPCLVLIHNLFRDQLDRYGEVDTVAQAWHRALLTLPPESTVVLNADDPAVADLGRDLHAQVVYFGLEDARHASGSAAHTADSQFCRRCGQRYTYSLLFYGHIGHYRCPQCGHQRPQPQVRLQRLDLHGTSDSRLFITYPGGALEILLPLPGLYNALNAVAAAAAALQLHVAPTHVRTALEGFNAAFGRIERVQAGFGGADMLIALIKNPVGASETVRMVIGSPQAEAAPLHLVIAINDKLADGTDVSWLWDADFEALVGRVAHVTVSGTRAADMAVRLKYAGLDTDKLSVVEALGDALDAALGGLPPGHTLYLLPTYTAMLELRADLAARGWVRRFWEE
jgi:UDP-N-acetylmuramyl tripeptide synthase